MEVRLGKLLSALDTKPSNPEIAAHLYFYVTARRPERLLIPPIPLGRAGAKISLHNHIKADGYGPGPATGSDGLSTYEEIIDAVAGNGTKIFAMTNHAAVHKLESGSDAPLARSYGIGLDEEAYLRWREGRASLPQDFFVLPGVELDIRERGENVRGRHLLAINSRYSDFLRLFREAGIAGDFSADPEERQRQLCKGVNRLGYRRVARGLARLDNVLVIAPHPYAPFIGACREIGSADAFEAANADAVISLIMPRVLRREAHLEGSYPLALWMATLPFFRAAKGAPAVHSPDRHWAKMPDFYESFAEGLPLGEYSRLADPRDRITGDLKTAVKAGGIFGGVNPQFIDPSTGWLTAEAEATTGSYFRNHLAGYYRTLAPVMDRLSGPISEPLRSARAAYWRNREETGALERAIGEKIFGIPAAAYDLAEKK